MKFKELTREVCRRDAGAIHSNIAQTSEIVKHVLTILCETWKEDGECEVIELIKSYQQE